MKTRLRLIPLILLAILMSACGPETDSTATEGVSISEVYTAAAMTLTAQANMATPTFTLIPSITPTVWASPTLMGSTPTSQAASSSSYSSASYSTAYGCYNAAYVSDVTIADGTVLAPSEEFTKTWSLLNTGSCDWTEDFWITFSSGEDMDGDDKEIDDDVTSGDTASISVSLVAPDDEGTYTGYWRLATEDGTVFGEAVYVMIIVSDDAATLTPTLTATATSTSATATPTTSSSTTASATPTSTYTAVPTNTTAPTNTPLPTSTYTAAPEPTEETADETATATSD